MLVGIGFYTSKYSSKGISEYLIGGRTVNRYVVALSAVVSGRSAWRLLGVTGMTYSMGPSAIRAVLGYIIVELFLFLYYAKRLRNLPNLATVSRYPISMPPGLMMTTVG